MSCPSGAPTETAFGTCGKWSFAGAVVEGRDFKTGVARAVPGWGDVRLLAPHAELRLLACGQSALIDAQRLRCASCLPHTCRFLCDYAISCCAQSLRCDEASHILSLICLVLFSSQAASQAAQSTFGRGPHLRHA